MSEADRINKLIIHNRTEKPNKEILNAVYAIYYQRETKIEEMKIRREFFR